MKRRLIALGLALLLVLPLVSCGGKEAAQPNPPVAPPGVTDAAPDPAPAPADAPAPGPDAPADVPVDVPADVPVDAPAHVPVDTPVDAPVETPIPTPAPSANPTPKPSATPAPADTPAPAPDPVEPPKSVSASEVYAAVAKAAGAKYDDTTDYYDDYYSFSTSDVEDMAFYMPSMSSNIEEILVVKAKAGKADAVKSACKARQQEMAADAETYPETGAYVSGYQLVTQGDWVLFAVCQNASKAVSAFKSAAN